MNEILISILLLFSMGIMYYLLYANGYLVINSKRAVKYIGSMRGRKASFTSCTGYIKRVIKFKEDGSVQFYLDLDVSRGEVIMELFDETKECILKLDNTKQSANILVEASKRYYLVFRFRAASGSYLLSWK